MPKRIIEFTVPTIDIKVALKKYSYHKAPGTLASLCVLALKEYIRRHPMKNAPAVLQEWIEGEISDVPDNELANRIQRLLDTGKIRI